jgi:hypothetical protein
MERRVKIITHIPVNHKPGEKFSREINGNISLKQYRDSFYICLGECNILRIYPKDQIATAPLNGFWHYGYRSYYGCLIINIVDVEHHTFSPDPPNSSPLWKKIILVYSRNGELRVIKHIGTGIMEYFINTTTNEVTVHSEHTSEIITEENIHKFMLEYFELKNFFWTLPRVKNRRDYIPTYSFWTGKNSRKIN